MKKNRKQKKRDVIFLRRRLIFEEMGFRYILGFVFWYAIIIPITILIVDFKFGTGTFTEKYVEVCVNVGKVIILCLLICAIIDNVKHNQLIKNGRLIIAEIDKKPMIFNPLLVFFVYEKVKCFYRDYLEDKDWIFTGEYAELRFGTLALPDTSALTQERYIPILVDEKNYKRYFVLTRELVHSYRESLFDKPFYLTRVVREVDLRDVENGMKFSTSVKFR